MELPVVGDVFEHRYELRNVLGRGGFATVFLAWDQEMSRDVVIKALTPENGAYPPTVAARFAREARVFTKLQDPHNITVYDVGKSSSGVLYMVFEYVDGQELAALLAERGPLSPPAVAHILSQLLQALREAHGLNILHRDIKPANVLVYRYGDDPLRVKLLDFGIAKELREDAVKLTKTGHVIGTLRYMAPEQILGSAIGPQSDFYSLGLMGYELLCGTPAIAGAKQREILRNQVATEPLRIPPERAPPALRAVIERMMAREPSNRYGSASEALRDLTQIRDEVMSWSGEALPDRTAPEPAPVTQHLPEPPASADHEPKRSFAWLYLLPVVGALLGIGLGVVLSGGDEEPPRVVNLPVAEPGRLKAEVERSSPPLLDTGVRVTELADADDGCGQPPPFTGLGRMSDNAFGGPAWSVYIPENYDPHRRVPLILLFHRNLRHGALMIEQARMDKIAEQHGAILISPDSFDPFGWSDEAIETVQLAVEYTSSKLCVDPRRRFALGDNSGAAFLRRLMCVYPLSAAAFAFNGEARTCQPVVPTPRLKIWGRRDRNVPADGGIGCNPLDGKHARAASIENNWRHAYQCAGDAKSWGEFAGGSCWAYRDCGVAELVTCATDGGHQWPGTVPPVRAQNCASEPPEADFPHAEAVWQFYTDFGRLLPAPSDEGGDR